MSWPRWIEIFLIAFAMLSIAIAEAAVRQLGRPLDAGRARHLGREVMKAPAHDLGVQRLIGVRPEHIREEARVEPTMRLASVTVSGPPRR